MKKFAMSAIVALGVTAVAAPAFANHHKEKEEMAEVTERNARGQATKIMMTGKVYDVCVANSQDNCINPREAGLHFGNVPLDHWPGAPASELPAQAKRGAPHSD